MQPVQAQDDPGSFFLSLAPMQVDPGQILGLNLTSLGLVLDWNSSTLPLSQSRHLSRLGSL